MDKGKVNEKSEQENEGTNKRTNKEYYITSLNVGACISTEDVDELLSLRASSSRSVLLEPEVTPSFSWPNVPADIWCTTLG